LYVFLVSPMRATCLDHLVHLDLITLIIFDAAYKSWSSSLCSLLQPHSTSPPFNTLFPNTLNLCSSLSVTDLVSHPYETIGKIVVLYRMRLT
jgi:hypothetical protein